MVAFWAFVGAHLAMYFLCVCVSFGTGPHHKGEEVLILSIWCAARVAVVRILYVRGIDHSACDMLRVERERMFWL